MRCLCDLICLILHWFWARPVGCVRSFLYLCMFLVVVLGVVWCMLRVCICVVFEDGRGFLLMLLPFVLLFLFVIGNDGCVKESVFWYFIILVGVILLCVVFTFEFLGLC